MMPVDVDEAASQVERPPEAILNPPPVYGCTRCDWPGGRTLADLGEHLLSNTGHRPEVRERVEAVA